MTSVGFTPHDPAAQPGDVLARIRGGLVVSCQAYPGEPMRDPGTMARMAQAVAAGGASGIRAQGIDDLHLIRAGVDLPLIGLRKVDAAGPVKITPTVQDALAVAAAGADIVALDATARARPDGSRVADIVRAVQQETGRLVMADVSTYDEGAAAQDAGADVVGTTLSGYVEGHAAHEGPDLELVRRLSASLTCPVVAEGRVHRPQHVTEAFRAGAFAVVVGTAITHPTTITRWFAEAVDR